MKFYSLLSVLFLIVLVSFSLCENPQVKISDGEIKGKYLKSREDKTYTAFVGIPYAKPSKKFELAESPEPWEGIRDATASGSQCLQTDLFAGFTNKVSGDEDCLFINVYVPMSKKDMPVMVFIHGGAFVTGAGSDYEADYFMDHGVILVTLNYRLGALGFLSTNDGVIEGNLGLKDQHLALKWVQKNIHSFGGDSKKVTIFGESAGAASVHYHVLSPLSEGLFQQAILQSGTAISPWAFTDKPADAAFKLGNKIGCNTDCSKKLLKCLQEKSADEITAFNSAFSEWHIDPITVFRPVADSPKSKLVFIPENPQKLLQDGNFHKIPMLITVCKDEGLLLHSAVVSRSEKLTNEMNEEWRQILPITLYYNHLGLSANHQDSISAEVKNFYFGSKTIGKDTITNLTNMYSDRLFIHSLQKSAYFHAKLTTVYTGLLSYQGEISLTSFFGIQENLGVAHGDDLIYLFPMRFLPKLSTIEDLRLSKFLVSIWTKFATSGKPEGTVQSVKWMPFSTRFPTWFNLNFPQEILENPFQERIEFWDKIWRKTKRDEL